MQYGIGPEPPTLDQRAKPRMDLHRENQPQSYGESSSSSDVETELFIGLPEARIRRISPKLN